MNANKVGINNAVPKFAIHMTTDDDEGFARELVKVLPDNSVIIASDITLDEALMAIRDMATSLAERARHKEKMELSCPKCGKTTSLDIATNFILSWGGSWVFHCEYCEAIWKIQLKFKEMKDNKEH